MKKRIDPVAIKSVSDFLNSQIDLLKNAKNKLLIDIEKINTVYKGIDASVIVEKYKERLSKIDVIILNYENFSKYMQNVSMAYSDNVNESKNELQQAIQTNSSYLGNTGISTEVLQNMQANTMKI